MVPHRAHLANLEELPPPAATEVMAMTQRALRVLRQVLAPHGFNLGINGGKVAGPGVADHVHQHLVPRWDGNTNFMPILAHTKILNDRLPTSYAEFAAPFNHHPHRPPLSY